MYKIIASDLDGTLLSPEHVITPYTRSVLQKLHKKGEHFVFATGRHHVDVAEIRKNVGIPACMITSNGARVHDENNNLIFSKNVDPEIVTQLVDLMKDQDGLTTHIYNGDEWYLNRVNDRLKAFHAESGFHYEVFNPATPPKDNTAKIFFTHSNHDLLVNFENKMLAMFGDKISVAFSHPFCLEVMGEGVSKGHAVQKVAELKGYSLNECIAFGDGMNDVEMLSMAKKGLVMATAHERVKTALSDLEVIGSNADDAVAHYLEDHLIEITA